MEVDAIQLSFMACGTYDLHAFSPPDILPVHVMPIGFGVGVAIVLPTRLLYLEATASMMAPLPRFHGVVYISFHG